MKNSTSSKRLSVMALIFSLAAGVSGTLSPILPTPAPQGMAVVFTICLLVTLRFMWLDQKKKRQEYTDTLGTKDQELRRLASSLAAALPAFGLLAEEDALLNRLSTNPRQDLGAPDPRLPPLEAVQTFIAGFDKSIRVPKGLSECIGPLNTRRVIESARLRIPYLEALLDRIASDTEDSAMKLIQDFDSISDKTGSAESTAKKALEALQGHAGEEGMEVLVTRSSETIQIQQELLKEFTEANKQNGERIKKIAGLVKRSVELVGRIQDIAERSKLIAFNLAIESAKFGSKGLGFKVIVNELQKLNDGTAAFAHDIMETIDAFDRNNRELLDQWLGRIELLTERVSQGNDQAKIAVQALASAYRTNQSVFTSLSENAIVVNRSMEDILSALQFQDITRQQVEAAHAFLLDLDSSLLKSAPAVEMPMPAELAISVKREIRDALSKHVKVSKDLELFDIIERRSL